MGQGERQRHRERERERESRGSALTMICVKHYYGFGGFAQLIEQGKGFT